MNGQTKVLVYENGENFKKEENEKELYISIDVMEFQTK